MNVHNFFDCNQNSFVIYIQITSPEHLENPKHLKIIHFPGSFTIPNADQIPSKNTYMLDYTFSKKIIHTKN